MLDNINDAILETDRDHRLMYFSKTFRENFGIDTDRFQGAELWDLVLPETDGSLTNPASTPWRAMLRHEPFQGIAGQLRQSDTDVLDVVWRGVPRFDAGEVFLGYMIFVEARQATAPRDGQVDARFRDFATTTSDCLWEVDADLVVTFISDRITDYTGVPAGEYIGTRLGENESVKDLDAGGGFAAIRSFVERRQPFRDVPGAVRTPDDILHVTRSGVPVFDDDGSFRGYRLVTRDITAETQAKAYLKLQEQEISEKEERFRNFADASTDLYYELDAKDTLTHVFGPYYEMTGRDPDALIGRNVFEVGQERSVTIGNANKGMYDAIRERKPYRSHFGVLIRSDGTLMDVRRAGIPRFDNDGTYLGYRFICSDATEEAQERRDREAAEAKFRDFASAAADVFIELDANFTVTYVLGPYEEMSGRGPQYLIGQNIFEWMDAQTDEIRKANTEAYDHYKAKKPFRNLFGLVPLEDGGARDVVRHGIPKFDEDGTFLGYSVVMSVATAEVQARRERALAEARFRDYAEASSDFLLEIDAEGNHRHIAGNFFEITGRQAEDMLGKNLFSFIEDRHPMFASVNSTVIEALRSRKPFKGLYGLLQNEAGDLIDVRRSGVPVHDEDGAFQGFRIVITVCTAEMRERREREHAEARFREFADVSSDYLSELDAEHRFTFVGGSYHEHTGIDPESLLGETPWGMPPAQDPDVQAASQDIWDAIRSKQSFRGIYSKTVTHTGELIDVVRRGVARYDAEGNFLGHRIATTVVTAEMAERRERLIAEERFRDFAEATSDWFWETDADGNIKVLSLSGASLPWDDHACRDQTRGLDAPGETPTLEANTPVMKLIAQRQPFRNVRGQIQTPERTLEVMRSGIPKFDEAGTFLGFRGATSDISQLVYAEQEKERLQETLSHAERLKAVGQLAGGIAHDFNNILAVIMGNIELVQDDPGSRDVTDYLEASLEASRRGASLTSQLLSYSRRQALSPQPIDAMKMLNGVSVMLNRTISERISIETVAAGGLWNFIADPRQLETVMFNLAINARDAMPDGGKLTLEVYNARLDIAYAENDPDLEPGQYVCFAVTDNGTGMDPETASHAFEPFFTTKEVGEGSGLGLSMAYGFAKQSGGHIKIYSELGEGTTIKLYLPRTPDPMPVETEEPKSRQGAVVGARVLVVEDDPSVLKTMIGYLRSLKCDVASATNSTDAVELVSQHQDFDIFLVDVVLPGQLTGHRLAEALLEKCPNATVVFISGYTENAIIHNGQLDPDVRLLQKPFSKAELAATLLRALKA